MNGWCPENDRAWQAEQAERYGENTLKARIAALEAERNKLREALEAIANTGEGWLNKKRTRAVANAALAETEKRTDK